MVYFLIASFVIYLSFYYNANLQLPRHAMFIFRKGKDFMA